MDSKTAPPVPPPIPAHVIAGFLGAGKTTTLLHLLKGLKARGERCAVLVNEFGALGVDGATLTGGAAVEVITMSHCAAYLKNCS